MQSRLSPIPVRWREHGAPGLMAAVLPGLAGQCPSLLFDAHHGGHALSLCVLSARVGLPAAPAQLAIALIVAILPAAQPSLARLARRQATQDASPIDYWTMTIRREKT